MSAWGVDGDRGDSTAEVRVGLERKDREASFWVMLGDDWRKADWAVMKEGRRESRARGPVIAAIANPT